MKPDMWNRLACIGAAALLCASAVAQEFPARPIRVVVPFPPGGGTDVVARAVAPKMSEFLGQPVIIDNRAGAGGNTGTEAVAKSPADGHTLLVASAATAINTTLAKNLTWDLSKDFAPVVLLVINQSLLVAHPSVPVSSVKDLLALAKARTEANTFTVDSYDEYKARIKVGGFFRVFLDHENPEVENRLQEDTKSTVRCIPFDAPEEEGPCMITGKLCNYRVYAAQSY